MSPTNPVNWFEIYVTDMERSTRFYSRMLGVDLAKLEVPGDTTEMWTFPMVQNVPGATGALVRVEGLKPGGMGTVVYFSCADCAVEAGRAVEAGGTVERAKMAIGPYGFIALVRDPDGNLVGLHSHT